MTDTTRDLIQRMAKRLDLLHCQYNVPNQSALIDEAHAYLDQPTDEELEAIARAAEIQYMKERGGLTASTPDGIHAQLRAQRIAGLRAVAAAELRGATTTQENNQ